MEKFAIMPLTLAERLVSLASKEGIKVEKIHNQQTCTKGCSITVEVWADRDDLESIQKIWANDQERNFLGLEFDRELIQQVFDTSKDSAICPACSHEFATSLSECPSCGLCF